MQVYYDKLYKGRLRRMMYWLLYEPTYVLGDDGRYYEI